QRQDYGDVLVSSSLIPYDNRDIKPAPSARRSTRSSAVLTKFQGILRALALRCTNMTDVPQYVVDYERATRQAASSALISLFQREQERGGHSFQVHIGALLSGEASIHTRVFRDELAKAVP